MVVGRLAQGTGAALLRDASRFGIIAETGDAIQGLRFLAQPRRYESQGDVDKEYWLEAFHDPPLPLDLPADHPRPAVKTFRAGQHRAVFDSEFYAQLREASQQHRCTLFQLLLASVVGWLFKITGQSDIVVGIPHAGQMSSDLLGDLDGSESLVGHCASLLPIRIRRVGDQSFDDLILSVKQRLIESSSHLGFTFSKVAKAIKLRAGSQ